MEAEKFIAEIENRLYPLASPERAKAMSAYLLNQFQFIGLPAPVRRAAVKDLMKIRFEHVNQLLSVATLLWSKNEREFRYIAIDLLGQHSTLLGTEHLSELRGLLVRDSWWETVDGLSGVISSVMLAEQRRHAQTQTQHQTICVMDAWLTDADFWVRRAAMLYQLGWRLETNTMRLCNYALSLAGEKEFFIRKAIGWALRDYARWNPDFVMQFVLENTDLWSPLTKREACKHLKIQISVELHALA